MFVCSDSVAVRTDDVALGEFSFQILHRPSKAGEVEPFLSSWKLSSTILTWNVLQLLDVLADCLGSRSRFFLVVLHVARIVRVHVGLLTLLAVRRQSIVARSIYGK